MCATYEKALFEAFLHTLRKGFRSLLSSTNRTVTHRASNLFFYKNHDEDSFNSPTHGHNSAMNLGVFNMDIRCKHTVLSTYGI